MILEKMIIVRNVHTIAISVSSDLILSFTFFQSVEHLSWLGLFKDISSGTSLQPFWKKKNNHSKKNAEHCRRVFDKFTKMR